MKKEFVLGVLVFFLFVTTFFINFVDAQENRDELIVKAFECLQGKVDNNPSLTLEEAIFSTLAGVESDDTKSVIADEEDDNGACWPNGGCDVKTTAQVLIMKEETTTGDTSEIVDWLKTKTGAIQGLTWYLQITSGNLGPDTCSLFYQNSESVITLDENMKISGNPGSCFTIDQNSYWLRINENCLNELFEISCETDQFKTNLLYRENQGGTIFVSSNTNVGDANARVPEEIKASCFVSSSGDCDYEASLWATTALYVADEDTSEYSPYLRALAFTTENKKYFPSAFLYHILADTSGDNDIFNEIIDQKIRGGLFDVGSSHGKIYDSALAILSLGGADSPDLTTSTIPALFDLQDEQGCFGSIGDTGLILWASQWSTQNLDVCTVEGDRTTPWINSCCSGLTKLEDSVLQNDASCSEDPTVDGVCSACGDDSCNPDTGENVCNCPADCLSDTPTCIDGSWWQPEIGLIDTTNVTGYCQLKGGSDFLNGCCPQGYDCSDTDDSAICEVIPGYPEPEPRIDSCFQGYWYDSNGVQIDTKTTAGYCHLETDTTDWPAGCCPSGYSCDDSDGSANSTCVYVGGGGGGTTTSGTSCESANYFCVADAFTCIGDGGTPKNEFSCQGYEKCCTVDNVLPSCFELAGSVCRFDEDCSGSSLPSFDGACCTDACIPQSDVVPEDDTPTTSTNSCINNADCLSGEECDAGLCVTSSGSSAWIWITILAILIILIVLGIIYKDKIRLWWFKRKSKTKVSGVPSGSSGMPAQFMRRPPPRFGPPMGSPVGRVAPRQYPPSQRTNRMISPKDKEMEETLKKLRDISK